MDIRNCKLCGRMFDYSGNSLCPNCNKEMEDKFQGVKKYIYENPGANLASISEDNEVPLPLIKKWIKEERLMFAKDSGILFQCEKCGKPIRTGRYCAECKKSMSESLEAVYQNKAPAAKKSDTDHNPKMRFLGN